MKPFSTRKSDKYPLIIRRLLTLPSIIKKLLGISITFILVYELVLMEFDAPFQQFFVIGTVLIKLSYSLLSASIFYFLIQHLPKETKRIKTFRGIHNRVIQIRKIFEKIKHRIEMNPNRLLSDGFGDYDSFTEYYNCKIKEAVDIINTIYTFQDTLDSDVLFLIVNFEDDLKNVKFEVHPDDMVTNVKSVQEFTNLSFKSIDKIYEKVWEKYGMLWHDYNELYRKYHVMTENKNEAI